MAPLDQSAYYIWVIGGSCLGVRSSVLVFFWTHWLCGMWSLLWINLFTVIPFIYGMKPKSTLFQWVCVCASISACECNNACLCDWVSECVSVCVCVCVCECVYVCPTRPTALMLQTHAVTNPSEIQITDNLKPHYYSPSQPMDVQGGEGPSESSQSSSFYFPFLESRLLIRKWTWGVSYTVSCLRWIKKYHHLYCRLHEWRS